jgi:hypothetical protein
MVKKLIDSLKSATGFIAVLHKFENPDFFAGVKTKNDCYAQIKENKCMPDDLPGCSHTMAHSCTREEECSKPQHSW